jgi:hypothetical protein
VNTATVSTNEASTWPVRYLCSVFTFFYADAGTILRLGREIRNAKMKRLAATKPAGSASHQPARTLCYGAAAPKAFGGGGWGRN